MFVDVMWMTVKIGRDVLLFNNGQAQTPLPVCVCTTCRTM